MIRIITADRWGLWELPEGEPGPARRVGVGLPPCPGLMLGGRPRDCWAVVTCPGCQGDFLSALSCANSEIMAKNDSILHTCQALLSCCTLTFFTPHSNTIWECFRLQKNPKHSKIKPSTQSPKAGKGKKLAWFAGGRLLPLPPPSH